MPSVELSAGTIEYARQRRRRPGRRAVRRPGDRPVALGRRRRRARRATVRCIVPTLPWGAHRIPMHPDADLTMRGQAAILGEFIEALDLDDVTLVENDTAMAQVLCAGGCDRVGRLVITSCEAFDNYPPGLPGKAVAVAAKLPGRDLPDDAAAAPALVSPQPARVRPDGQAADPARRARPLARAAADPARDPPRPAQVRREPRPLRAREAARGCAASTGPRSSSGRPRTA